MYIMIFYYFHFQTFHVSTGFNVGYLSMMGSLYIELRLFLYDDLDTIILHIHILLTYELPTEHMKTNLNYCVVSFTNTYLNVSEFILIINL